MAGIRKIGFVVTPLCLKSVFLAIIMFGAAQCLAIVMSH